RRQVSRAVPGYRHRLPQTGERGGRVVSGTLLETRRVGPLNDVEAGADLVDDDAADRRSGGNLTLLAPRQVGDPLIDRAQRAERVEIHLRERRAVEAQVAL